MTRRIRRAATACPVLIAAAVTLALALFITAGSRVTAAPATGQEATRASSNADLVARGKYIVEGIAACADCHTPRNRNGELERSRWLAGAPVFMQPTQAVPGWAIVAPRLAGLPPGSDAEVVTLLTTGVWRNGQLPRQPMPRFRMTRSDAEAVIAYLRSL